MHHSSPGMDATTTEHPRLHTGLPSGILVDTLAVDPKTPDTLYAGLGYTVDGQHPAGGMFKSTDGAGSWRAIGVVGDPICGDGARCRLEECDDNNLVDGDGCDANCTVTRCGNGIATAGEECDDQNSDPTDGCTNACTLCGNGTLTPPEECDDGNRSNTDACTNACLHNLCGDGFRNPATEECDDGGGSNTDDCLNNCTINVCGDGFVNPAVEQCDDGNLANTDACRNNCQANVCGDGFLNPATEQCDDGNLLDGDGCDSNCTPTTCGNGIVTAGEECDDGNRHPYDGCTNTCTICGNRIVTPPEECDDGNTDPFDGCTNACSRCGNGTVTPPERCDDGNLIDGDGCDGDCIGPSCGNGRVDANEECDDGGICVGGAGAGTRCTSQQCPGGDCQTFGGAGCASNCTEETRKIFRWSPGQIQDGALVPGSSGAVIQGSSPLPLAIAGSLTLTTGKPTAGTGGGDVPVVVRAQDFRFAPISVPFQACLCLRAVANPTFGPGNAGTGTIACGAAGLSNVDITTSIEHNTTPIDPTCANGTLEGTCADGICQRSLNAEAVCTSIADCNPAHPSACNGREVTTFSGVGPSGSAVIEVGMTSWIIGDYGRCSIDPTDPRKGRDGIPCTDDDPDRSNTLERYCGGPRLRSYSPRGTGQPCLVSFLPSHLQLRLTTGTARAVVLDANNQPGNAFADDQCNGTPCVTAADGNPFDCEALATDAHDELRDVSLVAAFGTLDNAGLGDTVTTIVLGGPLCGGDCDGDGQATVDELVTLVRIALDNGSVSACDIGDVNHDGQITVDEIIAAVVLTLEGCG
jgi:cysteine-rich repeat protein